MKAWPTARRRGVRCQLRRCCSRVCNSSRASRWCSTSSRSRSPSGTSTSPPCCSRRRRSHRPRHCYCRSMGRSTEECAHSCGSSCTLRRGCRQTRLHARHALHAHRLCTACAPRVHRMCTAGAPQCALHVACCMCMLHVHVHVACACACVVHAPAGRGAAARRCHQHRRGIQCAHRRAALRRNRVQQGAPPLDTLPPYPYPYPYPSP